MERAVTDASGKAAAIWEATSAAARDWHLCKDRDLSHRLRFFVENQTNEREAVERDLVD